MNIGQTVKYEGHKEATVTGIGYGLIQVATKVSGYADKWWGEPEVFVKA